MNTFMSSSAVSIGFFILLAMAAILLLYNRTRRLIPHVAGYGAQRMCPSCGLITPRFKTNCVECGKPLGLG